MTVSEAIKNLQMELKCREKDVGIECLSYAYCTDCPYNVSSDTLTESMQVVIDLFQKGEEK